MDRTSPITVVLVEALIIAFSLRPLLFYQYTAIGPGRTRSRGRSLELAGTSSQNQETDASAYRVS